MKRIIKLGGSLFDLPDLRYRLNAWLAQNAPATNWIVAGGGEVIEAVRRLDRVHQLASKRVHWRCVDLLETTASIAAEVLGCSLLDVGAQWGNPAGDCCVVRVSSFYAPHLNSKVQLPESWETTTDSIAGLLALELDADELVLMKSVSVNSCAASDWITQGIVDPAFGMVAPLLPGTRIVNLRQQVP